MKRWFTAADLAKMSIAGVPSTKRAINRMAAKEEWTHRSRIDGAPLARKRKGRGGGWEFHYSILPSVTITDLVNRGQVPVDPQTGSKIASKSEWVVFDRLSDRKKKLAQFRFSVLVEIGKLQRGGMTKTAAVNLICSQHAQKYARSGDKKHNFSRGTVYNWFKQVQGRKKRDWLPTLAPRHNGRVAEQSIDPDIIDILRADYLRLEQPSFQACYERLKSIAAERDWNLPSARTLQRRFLKGVPEPVIVLKRKGYEALEAMFPPQTRDRTEFHALQAVNADGHTWDVFVTENGSKPFRPVMCAIQDLYSNKILAWRIGRTLGSDLVRLAFGDMFRNYGIPDICWLDNGREFASKMVTGGAPNRYRFKIVEEEPTGFLTALGVDVRWTRPYRGQSKPIERAFRDFCDHIAKHPKFAGAYTGNSSANKPANYGCRAIDITEFKAVVAAGIAAHNAREGRRTRVCQGCLSFDQAFEASYASATVRRATETQLRMCLLAGELRKTDRRSGVVRILGNTYWSDTLATMAGERVIARFDPDNLHSEIHIYRLDGSYVGTAPVWDTRGFSDAKAARAHSNVKKKFIKMQKELAQQQVALNAADIAALLPDDLPEEAAAAPKVVKPVFGMSGNAARKIEFDHDRFGENVAKLPVRREV